MVCVLKLTLTVNGLTGLTNRYTTTSNVILPKLQIVVWAV